MNHRRPVIRPKKEPAPKYRYCLECRHQLKAWRFPLCKLGMIAILRRTESLCQKCVSQWK